MRERSPSTALRVFLAIKSLNYGDLMVLIWYAFGMENTIYAYGETHHGTHNNQINIILVSKEFDAIFFEFPNDYQKFFDDYVNTGMMAERMKQTVEGASREGNDIEEELDILRKFSKEKNIPIVCIDSSKTKQGDYINKSEIGHWYLRSKSRDEDMFINIKSYLEDHKGNFLLLVGAGHLKDGLHERSREITLGTRLKKLLGTNYYSRILN